MPDASVPSAHPETETVRLSRRSIVRTAGHAAWAAPLVVAATAAPAMAASGPAALSVSIDELSSSAPVSGPSGGGPGSDPTKYAFVLGATLRNANTQPSVALTVTVDIAVSDASMLGNIQAVADGYDMSWVIGAGGTPTRRTLTFTADQQIGRNGVKPFRCFINTGSTVDPAPGSNNASFTVTARPGAPGTNGVATAVSPTTPAPGCGLC